MRKQLKAFSGLKQGIIDYIRVETMQILSCVFVIAKNKEFFISILNIIAASVRWVSSTQVVLNTKLTDWLRRTQTKEDDEK